MVVGQQEGGRAVGVERLVRRVDEVHALQHHVQGPCMCVCKCQCTYSKYMKTTRRGAGQLHSTETLDWLTAACGAREGEGARAAPRPTTHTLTHTHACLGQRPTILCSIPINTTIPLDDKTWREVNYCVIIRLTKKLETEKKPYVADSGSTKKKHLILQKPADSYFKYRRNMYMVGGRTFEIREIPCVM